MPSSHTKGQFSVGDIIAGCEIVQWLARGGMGDVYLAKDLTLERPVALKMLRSDVFGKHHVERFIQESKRLAQIDDPNVVTIYSAGEEKGQHYLTMQYVDGKNLSELMKGSRNQIPWSSNLRIIRLAAKGLRAVHRKKLIHRDIKPSNIMLSSDSKVLLMDFGLVRDESQSDLTSNGELVGTPLFMSPEQCRGEELDHRSDIYSLGATLYFLLTKTPPIKEKTTLEIIYRISKEPFVNDVRKLNSSVPKSVEELLDKAMAFRPEDRFANTSALRRAISQVLRQENLDDADTWETGSFMNSIHETHVNRLPPKTDANKAAIPLEVPPVVEKTRLVASKIRWIVTSALFAIATMLVVYLYFIAPAGSTDNSTRFKGMVSIEAGYAQLGNQESDIRKFLNDYMPGDRSLNTVIKICLEEPYTRVRVESFWIDQYEVTNSQYSEFVTATGYSPPSHWLGGKIPGSLQQHPVVNVTFDDAEAYANWAGKQLPTREQWMRAFRGDQDRLFPWGNEFKVSIANVSDLPKLSETTTPVTDTPADVSLFKVYNLAGNVSEFVKGEFVFKGKDYRMGKGSSFGGLGGVYALGPMHTKNGMKYRSNNIGFRCVIDEK